MKGLAPTGRTALAFGSYGWGGQSVGIIENILKECNFKTLENIRLQYVPDESDLEKVKENLKEQIG